LCFGWQTPVEDVPLAIAPFQGRVLVGVGKLLRIYDLGKKKLLRKCENKVRQGSVFINVPKASLHGLLAVNVTILDPHIGPRAYRCKNV